MNGFVIKALGFFDGVMIFTGDLGVAQCFLKSPSDCIVFSKVMASAGFATKSGERSLKALLETLKTPGAVLKDDGGSYAGEPYFTTKLQLTPTQSEMLQNIIKDPQKMGFDNGTIL